MPHLEDGQSVVFVSHFAAMRCRALMQQLGGEANVTPVEMLTLPYVARLDGPARVRVHGTKSHLPVAALPSARTVEFLQKTAAVFPQLVPAENVLYTSLNNAGPIMQPALLLLNAGRTESTAGQGWNLFADGFTRSVAEVALRVDAERSTLCHALGIGGTPPAGSPVHLVPGEAATGAALSKAVRNNPVLTNPDIANPQSLTDRYVSEAVPFGLVPMASIAAMFSVPVPVINSLICLASTANRTDYVQEGLTVDKLGISATSLSELLTGVR